MIRAGRFDRRVTIQSVAVTLDGAGQDVETWSDVVIVWAAVKPERGDERFLAQQIVGKAVTTFQIRHRTGITVKNRLLHDGKTWDIHDVREIGRRDLLEIDATARSE